MESEVYLFTYNGFSGTCDETKRAKYTAKFKEWTRDPGVAKFVCSDGKERLIPTYALVAGSNKLGIPKQDMSNKGYFGQPCHS